MKKPSKALRRSKPKSDEEYVSGMSGMVVPFCRGALKPDCLNLSQYRQRGWTVSNSFLVTNKCISTIRCGLRVFYKAGCGGGVGQLATPAVGLRPGAFWRASLLSGLGHFSAEVSGDERYWVSVSAGTCRVNGFCQEVASGRMV